MYIYEKNVNYFTIMLCLLLLCLIVLSKKNIKDDIQFYTLIIIILLIIISCLIDNNKLSLRYIEKYNNYQKLYEGFINFEDSKFCFNRNKEHNFYHKKIDKRTDNLRYIETKDRKNLELNDEEIKTKEFELLNEEYLVNGEQF